MSYVIGQESITLS